MLHFSPFLIPVCPFIYRLVYFKYAASHFLPSVHFDLSLSATRFLFNPDFIYSSFLSVFVYLLFMFCFSYLTLFTGAFIFAGFVCFLLVFILLLFPQLLVLLSFLLFLLF